MIDLKAYVVCPNCGGAVPKARFCSECGSSLKGAKQVKRGKDQPEPLSDEGLTFLVDCCKKRIATVGGDGYEEIVLYADEKTGEYYLHTYRKYADMQQEEHASYIASKELVGKVFQYIEENNLVTWKDNKGIPLCGGDFILKFKLNNEIIRLDSSKMMDNLKAYSEISSMLYDETTEEKRRYQ